MHPEEEPPLNQCLCAQTRTWVRQECRRQRSKPAWSLRPCAHEECVEGSPAGILLLLCACLALAAIIHGDALERLRAIEQGNEA